MKILFTIFILVSLQAIASEKDFEIDIDALSSADKKLTKSSGDLCNTLGKEGCAAFNSACKTSPLPNSCFMRNFLFYAIDIELCGNENHTKCAEDRINYSEKISIFSEKHAGMPGIGRAALNACHVFFIVKPKSEHLQKLQNDIHQAIPDIAIYTENKKYYECIKDNYLKKAVP